MVVVVVVVVFGLTFVLLFWLSLFLCLLLILSSVARIKAVRGGKKLKALAGGQTFV